VEGPRLSDEHAGRDGDRDGWFVHPERDANSSSLFSFDGAGLDDSLSAHSVRRLALSRERATLSVDRAALSVDRPGLDSHVAGHDVHADLGAISSSGLSFERDSDVEASSGPFERWACPLRGEAEPLRE